MTQFFRSRKKFSTTYAILSFFFPTVHENFKFLKNYPYDFHKILHSHSTPKGLAQKQPFFDFFDFRKNCPYDSNEILYSPSTLYYGPLCVISSNSYCWDVRNIAKINPKMSKKQPFLVGAFPLREKCPTIAVTVFFLQTTILTLIGPLFRNNPETT